MACGLRPTTPDQPHTAPSTHEFFKASGNLLRGAQKNGRTQSPRKLSVRPRDEFPPGIPQRVALQQSPLALGRPHHIVNPNRRALPINSSTRNPQPAISPQRRTALQLTTAGLKKPLARAHNYRHNEIQTRAGFPTLESPVRCLKDRVHLRLLRPFEILSDLLRQRTRLSS